jgi:integrase
MPCVECKFVRLQKVWGAFFAGLGSTPQQGPSLQSAVDELAQEQEEEGLSCKHRKACRNYLLSVIKGREELPIQLFTPEFITEWFSSRDEAPASRGSNLGRLGALGSFAVRKGYLSENPVKRIRPPKLHRTPPQIITPDQARTLLRLAPIEIRAEIVLGMFGGCRASEVLRLDWDAIDLDRGIVRLDKTKTGRRRILKLHPTAVAWLRTIPSREGPVTPAAITIRRRKRELGKAVFGGKWPANVLRHSAASYLLALHEDAGKVAFMLGNSARILMQHYSELVTPEDCARFWAILPTPTHSAPPACDRQPSTDQQTGPGTECNSRNQGAGSP